VALEWQFSPTSRTTFDGGVVTIGDGSDDYSIITSTESETAISPLETHPDAPAI
jgi:hypothetical protein